VKEIALVGSQLIHEDPYLVYFNGTERALLERYGKKWMAAFLLRRGDLAPRTHEVRVTRVWSPQTEAAQRVASAFQVKVCASLQESLDGADGAMVMDEDVVSRSHLVEQCLGRGLRVFADKMLSDDPSRTHALVKRARASGGDVRAWSQAYFYVENEQVRALGPCGSGWLSAHYDAQYALTYGPHAVSMLQGAFRLRLVAYETLRCTTDERMGLLTLEGDTRIVTQFATALSSEVILAYRTCAKGAAGAVLLRDRACDHGASFERSAQAMLDFFMGRPCPVTIEDVLEHSRIMRHLFGGGDGEIPPRI